MNKTLQKAITKAAVYKGYIIALVVAIILIVIYLKREKIMDALGVGIGTSGNAGAGGSTAKTPTVTTTTAYTDDTVLRKGMKGEKVKELQLLLNKALEAAKKKLPAFFKHIQPLVVDGIFGDKTELAIKALTESKHKEISLARARELLNQ